MKTYIGTKVVQATPMTRGEYADSRGGQYYQREGDKREDEGYKVVYPDGYISWCPNKQFEEANCAIYEGMGFGGAIHMLKQGKKVSRKGWNGKGMFLYYVPDAKYPAKYNEKHTMMGMFPDDMVPYCAYIAMKTAQNNVVPWLASQTDMLSNDWIVVD